MNLIVGASIPLVSTEPVMIEAMQLASCAYTGKPV